MKTFTEEELNSIVEMLEDSLYERCGLNEIKLDNIDRSNWTLEDYNKEIRKLHEMIKTNQEAFAVPKIKVKNEKEK